jgi:putative endonuclease
MGSDDSNPTKAVQAKTVQARTVRAKTVRAKDALGRYGEDIAARHLVSLGFVVLERNWHCDLGELDIIARDGDVLVVCEVKTRSSLWHGSPFEAVTETKLHRVQRLGMRWMRERGVRPAAFRVDVVSVLRPSTGPTLVEHVRGLS